MLGPNKYTNSYKVGVAFPARILLKRFSTFKVSSEEGLTSLSN